LYSATINIFSETFVQLHLEDAFRMFTWDYNALSLKTKGSVFEKDFL